MTPLDWPERVAERRRQRRLGVWSQRWALCRDPRNCEDIQAASRAGFRTVLFDVGPWTPGDWAKVAQRCDLFAVRWGYWEHLRTQVDLDALVRLTNDRRRPVLGANVELELQTVLSPPVVADGLRATSASAVIPTYGWVQNDVDLGPLRPNTVALEMFPQEVPYLAPAREKTVQCLEHARSLGAYRVVPLYGAYRNYPAGEFDLSVPHGVYCLDDIQGRWDEWAT